ncbi:glycoside hydrolase family 30 protein [Granulicella aggregans]|uniref:glycoside hydrolase family 30 protein n=1 Tax=Granulicella aggregans TaxID=474949 RepID=UPI0021E0D546|nr:beta-glycosidase [Granulicella aggregans]
MTTKRWTRRRVLTTSMAAAAMAMGGTATSAIAQMPAPEVLEDERISMVTTTEASAWQKGKVLKPTFQWELLNLNIDSAKTVGRPMEGFGGCFNELGWTSLSALGESDRETVIRELFHPTEGARFTYCRMPIGANDYATEPYSLDETDGDFALQHFSIDHDRATLIPFIHAAIKQQPELKLWASPWTPPSWMKRNHFYAEAKAFAGMKENGIRPDQLGHDGEDMFIQKPEYFKAYAEYFGKFIDAYRAEGIRVGMVMPQNEFNSAQNFPSCTWTPEGLARFIRELGPQMRKRDVDVFFGTLERGNPKLLETVMLDKEAGSHIKGVGVQWAGKNAVATIHDEYPQLAIFQSEQECGDGKNSWSYAGYCWELMKQYFRSGATGYMYWNISTADGGVSTWGWPQNSLISVNTAEKTFRFNHDFYLLKHLTHFVDVGAKIARATGTCDDVLAFVNPGGTAVALLRNELSVPRLVQITADHTTFAVELPPDSISTVKMKLK